MMRTDRELKVEGRGQSLCEQSAPDSSSRRSTFRRGESGRKHPGLRPNTAAFTLMEVMIALVIFFMAVFAILGLLSTVLRNARLLQNKKSVDAGMVAAQQLCLTNKLTEEVQSGDFGDMYPDYTWTMDTYEAATNGLFQVDIIVQRGSSGAVESKMSVLRFAPDSARGSLSGGMRR